MYIHTDGAWERPPGRAAFHAHAGWSGQLMGNLSAVRKQWECCWRAPANVESCYKYDWLLHASAPRRRAGGWLGVLADSDVLFQCSAEELRARFERLGSPLVVSGERQWYPMPRRYPDRFGPAARDPNMSWLRSYKLRHQRQFYPNSGLLMGTAEGFEALTSAIKAVPGFPCCAFEGDSAGYKLDPCTSCKPVRRLPTPVRCAVEDQACMQVALASKTRAPPHVVDINASVFLSLNTLAPSDLALKGGRIAFRPTGEVPCILHSNGLKDTLSYLEPHISRDAPLWSVFSMAAQRSRPGYEQQHSGGGREWRPFRLKKELGIPL